MPEPELLQHDTIWTLKNRAMLLKNRNLLLWYEKLYERQFSCIENLDAKVVLEVGSGTSPLRLFHKDVITSDLLDLDHLDHSFDCHEIHRHDAIPDRSVDIITLTNVLHHLRSPLDFLVRAAVKLKPGGKVIMTEPYFSFLSRRIYRMLHHEPAEFDIPRPELPEIQGPLSSANMAIPFLIFLSDKEWDQPLRKLYDYSTKEIEHFSSIAYMATGGISRKIPIPHPVYRLILSIDLAFASRFPKLLSSFFIMKLTRKS